MAEGNRCWAAADGATEIIGAGAGEAAPVAGLAVVPEGDRGFSPPTVMGAASTAPLLALALALLLLLPRGRGGAGVMGAAAAAETMTGTGLAPPGGAPRFMIDMASMLRAQTPAIRVMKSKVDS